MTDFIEGEIHYQSRLFPERLDDYVGEDSGELPDAMQQILSIEARREWQLQG